MKKRIAAMLLALLMLVMSCAHAEEELLQLSPMDMMFLRGKEALSLLALGETDLAVETLGFVFDVESLQTEDTFREMVRGLTLIESGLVQTDVALFWLDEFGVWNLGIPLVEPVSWDVEALVLQTRDMTVFSGYSLSNWGALEEASVFAAEVYWNIEYAPGVPVLFADE